MLFGGGFKNRKSIAAEAAPARDGVLAEEDFEHAPDLHAAFSHVA
jgi:hypothetical protein